jgi:hypothetical protein
MTTNDYAYVEPDETHSGETWLYTYNGTSWIASVRINEVTPEGDNDTIEKTAQNLFRIKDQAFTIVEDNTKFVPNASLTFKTFWQSVLGKINGIITALAGMASKANDFVSPITESNRGVTQSDLTSLPVDPNSLVGRASPAESNPDHGVSWLFHLADIVFTPEAGWDARLFFDYVYYQRTQDYDYQSQRVGKIILSINSEGVRDPSIVDEWNNGELNTKGLYVLDMGAWDVSPHKMQIWAWKHTFSDSDSNQFLVEVRNLSGYAMMNVGFDSVVTYYNRNNMYDDDAGEFTAFTGKTVDDLLPVFPQNPWD